MRRLPRWTLIPAGLLLLLAACDDGRAPDLRAQGTRRSTRTATRTASRPAGRLLVLRLGDGVEVLRQRDLERVPARRRGAFRRGSGRWEVRSADGRVLSRGRFRIPRRRHALFGDVGGPARAVDVALERPVVWLRVPLSTGARRLILYDDQGRRRLGEVAL